jgi:glutathione S-transferase
VQSETKPILWHIPVSHYSEKVRWALAYKGVEHERKRPTPPIHMPVAVYLTRGRHKTFPVLQLDGQRIGDSTAIIAALERRFPEPPLYPADTGERRRALELEDWFDEEVGPYTRRLAFYELTRDRELLEEFAGHLSGPAARVRGLGATFVRTFVRLRYGVKGGSTAEHARRKVLEGLDRLEAELGDREYLVGDRFSVADLTAGALLYPIALPPEAPRVLGRPPKGLEELSGGLEGRPGYRWIEEMFRRHRGR